MSSSGTEAAYATIIGSNLAPKLRGSAEFTPYLNGTLLTVTVYGLPKQPGAGQTGGFFALHIHEGSECVALNQDDPFLSAGGHYNPYNVPHPYHAGDLPPLLSAKDGYAYLQVYTDRFTPQQVAGRTIIIHSGPDDFHTQPSGNAGKRIGCGKIRSGTSV
jgi:Cu-Zn family superoxide dismutase